MQPVPPLILLGIGAVFLYFLFVLGTPLHPIPAVLLASSVHFPDLLREFTDLAVGFAPVNDGNDVHIVWIGNKREAGVETAVMQHYVFPLAVNDSGLIQASSVRTEETSGAITHVAMSRLSGHPLVGMIRRRIEQEDLSYSVEMSDGMLPSSESTISIESGDDRSWGLPGSLHIMRAMMGATGNLVASRRYDQSLFRVYTAPTCVGGQPCIADSGIPGPSVASSPGYQLLVTELFSEGDSPLSVFTVTYGDEHDDHYNVSMCIFTLIDGDWVKHEIFKDPWLPRRNAFTPVLAHDGLEADEVQTMPFWFVKPVVALSKDSKTIAWLFLGRIFCLDYVNATVAGRPHGYVLETTHFSDLNTAVDLDMSEGKLNDDGTLFVVRNINKDILTFERNPTSQDPPVSSTEDVDEDGGSWWDDFFTITYEVGFFFDGSLESTPMREDPAVVASRRPEWKIKSMWPNHVDAKAAGKSIVAMSLVSDLPSHLLPKGRAPGGSYILVLYSNLVLNVLDLQASYEGSHMKRFIWQKWPMLTAMVGVIAVFVGNEARGGVSQYHAIFVSGLLFWILLSLTLSISD
ncbi:hypothetical protein HKX48_002940 [Thoreauomyces humboldtii]|nr:hypothetical protein HKX48_002940 [Thoreauomyces humboldtii]